MKWLWTGLLVSLGVGSAQAYTCEDVRALSQEQQAYYIKVFNITPAQQERIRHACYGQKTPHVIAAAVEASTHFGHRERDASVEK